MSYKECYQIYMIGVGGQGTIKTATIIGEAAIAQGLNVVMSEVHGMAQRGGTVVTELKIGNALSPLIEKYSADLLLAFEPSELLRATRVIKKDTHIIANCSTIVPFTVSLGISEYPDINQILARLSKKVNNVYLIDAGKIAQQAGHIITANIVILGAALATPQFPVKKEAIFESIRQNLPTRSIDMNIKALEMGYQEFSTFSNK
ncbi:MAG: indolepyruvate oxidoreductase subunit beta [Atribacterota bacterium]|nr:indolepyruvate oxidoreductase subunit beta [Atribacterota bacterium]MDD4896795.1 indolepyruvate oxidoreductase subunit beta [Atribacterota bacterium]MDD5637872.1 indolepyruvate oxidoreductase subunit beta [Atribacterota bacterium]